MAVVALIAAAEAADAGTSPELLGALDALRVAVTLFDSAERLIYCNRHFNHLFRSMPPREQLYGCTYAEMVRLEVCGGEIADFDTDIESFVARRRGQLRDGEFQPRDIPLSDGRIIEIKARRTKSGGWIALWTDVTAARHATMRQEDLVELSADAFAVWDRHDRLVACNAAYSEIHGHGSTDFIVNSSFEDLLRSTVQRGRFLIAGDPEAWIAQRLEAHRAPAGAMMVVTAAGDAYLMRDRATRDGGRATVFTDATEQRQIESALNEQTRAHERTKRALAKSQVQAKRHQSYLADLMRRLDQTAAEAEGAKTALLRTMSHELKTPLNAIIGFSDLLQLSPEQFSKEQIGEYSALIHLAGKNLLKLINQIIDLTKIAAQRFPLQLTNVTVGGALWMALDAARDKAERKSITLAVGECEPDLMVHADENAFGNVIAQLIDNAVSFTQNGGTVCVSAQRRKGFVLITVADDGPGVSPDDLVRILEPFEQAARGTNEHARGAGLGLPLAKALTELHGGVFSIASTLGDGFTATVEFPAA